MRSGPESWEKECFTASVRGVATKYPNYSDTHLWFLKICLITLELQLHVRWAEICGDSLSNAGNSKCDIKNISRWPSESGLITSKASKNQESITFWETGYLWVGKDITALWGALMNTVEGYYHHLSDALILGPWCSRVWMQLAQEGILPRNQPVFVLALRLHWTLKNRQFCLSGLQNMSRILPVGTLKSCGHRT